MLLLLIRFLLPFHIPTHFRSFPILIQMVGLTQVNISMCVKTQTLNVTVTADLWQSLNTKGNPERCIPTARFILGALGRG